MTQNTVGAFLIAGVVGAAAGCLPDYDTDRLRSSGYDNDGTSTTDARPPTVTPDFGTTVHQADPPPPLSGGTLAVAPDATTVVAADPDRDRVYIVDITAPSNVRTVPLRLHDEPGRVVVDTSNRAHVALRRGGGFVTIDLATAKVLARREVCSAPRGIAHDPAKDVVHVACAGGELVTFPAAGGPELHRRRFLRDLRDVVVVPGALIVSTFRDARTYRIEDGSDVLQERARTEDPLWGSPAVSWRMIALPNRQQRPLSYDDDGDAVLVAAQRVPASGNDVSVGPPPPTAPAQYYSDFTDPSVDPSSGAVPAACNVNGPSPLIIDGFYSVGVPNATLPVDAAATLDTIAIVAAGNGHTAALPQLVFIDRLVASARGDYGYQCASSTMDVAVPGLQLTSVAFVGDQTVVALSREPAALVIVDMHDYGRPSARIPLATDSREDTGHAIFHSNTGVGVACASCHPDGRDDGHAWRSVELGARRTPSLLGTLAGTAPYHWNGEAADLTALMHLTFQSRMHGPELSADREATIASWLTALPAPPPVRSRDATSAARGKTLFEGEARCSTCHAGPMHTNNATLDVGTGGAFQVPSLVGVSWRAPYLHDGTAPTVGSLLDRTHGGAPLSTSQKSDLEAYVGTL